jgi:mannose-1-phosphate guanylyltransferase
VTQPKYIPKPAKNRNNSNRQGLCGVVLASGAGQYLQPLKRRQHTDALPKQYVRCTGTRSMLERTYDRVERLIPRERLFTVVQESHLRFSRVADQLSERSEGTVIAQPRNETTMLALLLALTHVHKRFGDTIVASFPSDQLIWEDDRLMRYVRLAQTIVSHQPSKLVLLGVEPAYEESEYSYILPVDQWNNDGWGTRDVKHLVEKPNSAHAHELIVRGALWNTMLMVFNAATLLGFVKCLKPNLFRHFERLRETIGTPHEATVVRETFERVEAVDISRDLLQPVARLFPGSLCVLPVNDVLWSDRGAETRNIDTVKILRRTGYSVEPQQRRHTIFGSDRDESFGLDQPINISLQ